jgi:small subunit ribosomal protein S20
VANIKSQIKRNRQNEKRRLRNRVYRGAARTAVKNARSAISTGDPEVSKQTLLAAISELDRAAQKGVLHKNNAARRKSRLMKEFARMQPASAKLEAAPKVDEPVVEAKPKKASSRPAAVKEPVAEAKPKAKAEPKAKAAAKPKAETKPKAAPKTKAAPKKTAAKTTKK